MLMPLRRPRLALLAAAAAVALAAPSAAEPLRLAEALRRAAAADPSTAAATARREAAQAAIRQAGLKPTPSLNLEAENVSGTGGYSVLDRSETTLSYAWTLERSGKREARVGRARAEAEVVRLRAEARALDHLRDAQKAYADAWAAEAELLVAEARLVAAQQSQADVVRRVTSARDPLFAGSRAEALTAQAEIARDRAREAARTARALAASYWGGPGDFELGLDDFFNVAPPADLPELSPTDMALAEAERDVAAAVVRVEQVRGVADPALSGGLRYFADGSDVALVVGASIPLGAAKANQANVERARAERSAAEADLLAWKVARDREIVRLVARQRALAVESERIRAELIPHAIRAVEQVTAGFNRGGFSFSDVTEAQRALADARARRVEVLRDFHVGGAELDRLTGKHRSLLTPSSEERR
jgi:cobalt-zinc-cadmium efflux system outer membrane protein